MHIVFFDIDGTLATGTNVPDSARKALARLRENGDVAFICTGRPRSYVEANFPGLTDGFVCSNGRLAVCDGRRLVDRPLAPSQVADFVQVLDSLGAGYAFFGERDASYGGNPAYRHAADEAFSEDFFHEGVDVARVHAFNFDVYFEDAAHRTRITEALSESCLVNPHGPHPSADVTVLGYGKGDAVRDVAVALGVAAEDTYAFGDGINDISMLEAAGHGVAMGNAVDEVKRVAEYVTSAIDDGGVARGLAHFGLV